MCLVALALGQSARWPLLMAANRDEYFARPTEALAHWQSAGGQRIVSGRDLQAGGIWLGATPEGRVAVLTNVREPGEAATGRSRGGLPLAWLESAQSVEAFMATLEHQAYSGFNLLVGDARQQRWHWMSNRVPGPQGLAPGWQHQRLGPGVYGLSNAFLDSPWPKTLRLKAALREALATSLNTERLWRALADASPAQDDELPDTGVPLEAERLLSSAWVRFPHGRYGTRASTLLVAEASTEARDPEEGAWAVTLAETTWGADGRALGRRHEQMRWPQSARTISM